MKLDEYVDTIMTSLGAPIIDIEIEHQIPKIIQMAFRELKNYITDSTTMTIPYAEHMNLSDKNISTVLYVMRSQSEYLLGDYADTAWLLANRNFSAIPADDYTRAMLVKQVKNTLATDLDFKWEPETKDLYVYCNYPKPASITLQYIPDYQSVEDLTEPYWQTQLTKLALAMCKITLGRVRGKYTLNSATYGLDGDTLLAEGTAELNEIRNYLSDNSDMVMPID